MRLLSDRTRNFTDSVIRRMTRISNQYNAVNLSQGFPDFDPPEELTAALAKTALQGPHQYSITWGAQNFRQALAKKHQRFTGIEVDPEREIVVTCGSTEAMMCAMMTILLGVIYIVARSLGKYCGSDLSCRLTKQPVPITKNLGITLLPQAGVALGMALTAATLPDGALARNVVLFAVLIYELVGPALTKRSLLLAGEIVPEKKTSARTINQSKPPVNIH